jgi:hypothetical protein
VDLAKIFLIFVGFEFVAFIRAIVVEKLEPREFLLLTGYL